MFETQAIHSAMDALLSEAMGAAILVFDKSEPINEVALKRVVRRGEVVRKVKVKRKGFKVVRQGNKITFARLTPEEKRKRRRAARQAWRVGRGSRRAKAKRTMIRSKVRMKTLYGGGKR
jgi:hypothetical protein